MSERLNNTRMKKYISAIGFMAFITALVLSFAPAKAKTTIVGRINPADAAEVVWAISATDTLKAAPAQGQFFIEVKPGTYKLIVDAKEPYKDVTLENLQLKPDETLDVGEIPLKQ
jgi:hypothetical protein